MTLLSNTPRALTRVEFDFTHATPGLANGVPIGFTPNPGDVIIQWSLLVTQAFNGTTPLGDIGMGSGTVHGFYDYLGDNPNDMTRLAVAADNGGAGNITNLYYVAISWGPIYCTAADPLKVWVTQDGTLGGADPGATTGAAKALLIVGRA